jgi:hypothetical protein
MKKIILLTLGLNQSKWQIFELDQIQKKYNIEIHQIINFIYPDLLLSRGKIIRNTKIINFEKYIDWKNYFQKLIFLSKEKKEKIIVIDLITNYDTFGTSFKLLLINLFLKKNNITLMKLASHGQPDYKSEKVNNLYNNLITLFCRPAYFFGQIKFLIINNLVNLFFAGNYTKKILKQKKITKMNIIEYSSFECSKFFNLKKKNKTLNLKKKYAVFLADRHIYLPSENQMFDKHEKTFLTDEKWQVPLNNFLTNLEKLFNLKIIIAGHPKSKISLDKKSYYPRKVFSNQTLQLVNKAKFVITTCSTSMNYAVLFKKPILFITSDEIYKRKNLETRITLMAKYFDAIPVNINREFHRKKVKNFNGFNLKKISTYKSEFLSSIKDKKQNYEIILDTIKRI